MNSSTKTILIAGATALVVLVIAAAVFWWISPMWGVGGRAFGAGARSGPDAGFGAGMPGRFMGRGMMREMHAMADVENEYEFLANMIPHHEEAVDSARALRDGTEREVMREFATSIIEVQTREIEQMEAWLERWYPDRPPRAEYEPMMGDYRGLSGDRLDVAFLEDMIPHHMAAVMMSQQLIAGDLAEHDEVEDLAETIRDAQMREIRDMSRWLEEWGR